MRRQIALFSTLLVLSGCAENNITAEGPHSMVGGEAVALRQIDYVPLPDLGERAQPITISVYEIPDKTGAHLPNPNFAELSRAVTQGANELLIKALVETGSGSWFEVAERANLDALLNERRIAGTQINEQRQRDHVAAERLRIDLETRAIEDRIAKMQADVDREYANAAPGAELPSRETTQNNLEQFRLRLLSQIEPEKPFSAFAERAPLPQLKVSDYMLSGAIVAYDADTSSAGTGLRLAGLGTAVERRRDTMTVSLRLARVDTGQILSSKTVTQTVLSNRRTADALNYVTENTVLEFEAGYVTNEPRSFALDAAFRLALSEIIREMKTKGIW